MAEPLIFVTADQLSLRDSTSLGAVIDQAGYSLPSGFGVVGGDVDPDHGEIGLLARNAATGQCQVYQDTDTSGGNFIFASIGPTLACGAQVSDLEFINSGGGADLGWAIAMGNVVRAITPADADYDSLTVTAPGGASADLAAIGLTGAFGVVGRLLNRADGGSVGSPDFSGGANSIGIANPSPLSAAVINGPTSLDVSETSGVVYLLTDGKVYALAENGTAVLLGDAPAGTLAMFVDQASPDPGGNNGGTGGSGSTSADGGGSFKVGAMSGASLLVMLLALLLRHGLRARRRSWEV